MTAPDRSGITDFPLAPTGPSTHETLLELGQRFSPLLRIEPDLPPRPNMRGALDDVARLLLDQLVGKIISQHLWQICHKTDFAVVLVLLEKQPAIRYPMAGGQLCISTDLRHTHLAERQCVDDEIELLVHCIGHVIRDKPQP